MMIGTDRDGRHRELMADDLDLYRPLTDAETEAWRNGWATFPGAIETTEGVIVPDGRWHLDQPAVMSAGDVGGDIQISDAYGSRWVKANLDGTFGVVDADSYVVTRMAGLDDETDERGATLDSEGDPVMWVQTQIHFTTCTDPADPGSTEIHSDVQYDDGSLTLESLADLDTEARTAAERLVSLGAGWIGWDGVTR